MRDRRDIDGANLVQGHLRVGVRGAMRRILAAQLVGPRRIGNDNAIRTTTRQWRRLESYRLWLSDNFQALEWAIDTAGAVHVSLELAVLFWFGFGSGHDRLGLLQ